MKSAQQTSEAQKALQLSFLDAKIDALKEKEERASAAKHLWLAHHWPKDYQQRCSRIGKHHVCRRCAALYPLGFFLAFAAAFGYPLWPNSWDPLAIWILCLPATVTYVGEAVGLLSYNPKWQVGTTLITATAFGKALSYELLQRWSPEFWNPLIVFGLIWALATGFSAMTSKN